ncbi:MAG: hypothetical protein ABIJ56_14640 [Pseudomonadota bacterium]
MPLPKSLDVRDTSLLTLVDALGQPVPAEFQALARWNAGLEDSSAAIQWLLITFPAHVSANETSRYRLVTDGSAGTNPAPDTPVTVERDGDSITIDTGAAIFKIGESPSALFDEISLPDGTVRVTGGEMTGVVNDTALTHPTTRDVWIEHAGPLSAIVVIRGEYDMPEIGGGSLASMRRYVFSAGSGTAIVRHAVTWEGSLCDQATCDGVPNGLLVEKLRNTTIVNEEMSTNPAIIAINAEGASIDGYLMHAAIDDEDETFNAYVKQKLRDKRSDNLEYEMYVSGEPPEKGERADGAILFLFDWTGTITIALDHMHRHEPQALRLLEDGSLAVDIVDDAAWIGSRQGVYANFAISVDEYDFSLGPFTKEIWARLNHPLRAWPGAAWFHFSGAVGGIPPGELPDNVSGYDELVPAVLESTLDQVDVKGLNGIMTFGHYPRYWGTDLYGDELDCDGLDPTPGESWDDLYWCATWADYHNTVSTAVKWAMRSGQVEWLDEIAFPGALRMLHTQIMQCGPDDDYFYCGMAPAGYGGYRTDFNSSHGYFDNLMLYYWLTGDRTVVDTLERGAATMRDYLCDSPSGVCEPDDPPTDPWAGLHGRVASQWYSVFRFVGLSGDDSTFLDHWQANTARWLTQHYALAEHDGAMYGFIIDDPIEGEGTYTTAQTWMASLYDINMLSRLAIDTADEPIGDPPMAPTSVAAAWARTLVDYDAQLTCGEDPWPTMMDVSWIGNRIGGKIIDVSANCGGSDPVLYDTGKAAFPALLLRAGEQTADEDLWAMGEYLTEKTIESAQNDGSPLGKVQGLYLTRLHDAVAQIAAKAACEE